MIQINPVYKDKFKKCFGGFYYTSDKIKGNVLYFNKDLEYTSFHTFFGFNGEEKVYKCLENLLSLGYLMIVEEY